MFKKHIETLVNPKLPAKTRITVEEEIKIKAIIDVLIKQLDKPIKVRREEIKERIKDLKDRIIKDIKR